MSDVDRAKLTQPFPAEAIRTRPGGGGVQLRYVPAFTVIHRLNDACPSWDFAVLREWTDGPLSKAHVRLTIPGMGGREHVGVQVLSGRPGTEDVDAKGAVSDALKKAASLFGVGLELSGPDVEADDAPRARPQAARYPEPTPPAPSRPGATSAPTGGITERQVSYAYALGKARGLDERGVEQLVWEDYGKAIGELDRGEASNLLEGLKAPRAERVAGPVLEVPSGDSWTGFWAFARANGLGTKADAEEAIGGLGPDPADALARMKAAVSETLRTESMVL